MSSRNSQPLSRSLVLEDLGSCIPEIPFQTFMNHSTLPKPDFYIDAAMKLPALPLQVSGRLLDTEAPKDQNANRFLFATSSITEKNTSTMHHY